jgi:hypothetical protein
VNLWVVGKQKIIKKMIIFNLIYKDIKLKIYNKVVKKVYIPEIS